MENSSVEQLKNRADFVLELFNSREKKLKPEQKAKLVASRVTKGWAFMGQSAESHNKEVEIIMAHILERLK